MSRFIYQISSSQLNPALDIPSNIIYTYINMENRISKPRGRPSKYQDTFPESLIKFFSIPLSYPSLKSRTTYKNGDTKEEYIDKPNRIPFFSTWCHENNLTQAIFDEWVKPDSKYFKEDLFVSYKQCQELQKRFIVDNVMQGNANCSMGIFTLKNISGWRDEQFIKGEGFNNQTFIVNNLKEYVESVRSASTAGDKVTR
jgi:hypothetical protein